ncbi:hypothetical protein [Demequina zhanjiangensis]|uniref:Uncharacterized protein n=1 Tax=Demequina zhanjiangensis TaxID=3051659 RepID=A0ABT8G181_9MICO|nr:hypothetical protein [Demequina sp. SYSU T00b26]MDN4472880.1 hypothetical protein [Demequina sp. SYSU T00b26]
MAQLSGMQSLCNPAFMIVVPELQFRTRCVEGDPVFLGGVDVWTMEWQRTATAVLMQNSIGPNPQRVPTYRIPGPHRAVYFAATETSNCVCAF